MSARVLRVSPISAILPNLPRMLAFDGATCVLMGIMLTFATKPLAIALALPENLLFVAGVMLFPCALMMFAGAGRARWTATIARATIGLNLAWIVGSALVATALFSPNAVGLAFVWMQACAVAAITLVEWQALRRWPAATGAPGAAPAPDEVTT